MPCSHSCPLVVAALALLAAALPSTGRSDCWTSPGFNDYFNDYVAYFDSINRIPDEPALYRNYIRRETYDSTYFNSPASWVNSINDKQNDEGTMGWGRISGLYRLEVPDFPPIAISTRHLKAQEVLLSLLCPELADPFKPPLELGASRLHLP